MSVARDAGASPAAAGALRVLQVGGGWFPERAGGLDRYYHDLLRALPSANVAARGLVVGSSDVERESGGHVRAYARPDASMLHRWRQVRSAVADAIASDRPDVLVTHFAPYAFPIRRPRRLPLVVHFHGPWAAESRREGGGRIGTTLKALMERAVYARADRLIVLSRAFRSVLTQDYGVADDRIAIVPGGVDCDRFAPAAAISRAQARTTLGWPVDRPIVLAVRRLAGRMGLEGLVDAMTRVRRTAPDALCLIAGRGRLETALRERIAAADLTGHVRLLGFVPDDALPLAYRAADVSILPSQSLEGFGLSAVESLAAGTPAIVTAVGGLPEVVTALSPSLVIAAEVESIAAALSGALRAPSGLPNAEQCVAYARAQFDWPTIADNVVSEYRRAVDLRRLS